jgi:hypothetical protein
MLHALISEFEKFAGYPYNLDFDFSVLAQFQNFSMNNLGDPFIESNYGVHSRQFEVAVLDWFARLWDIQQDEYWGYITNCGTEGNLHGLLVGLVSIYVNTSPSRLEHINVTCTMDLFHVRIWTWLFYFGFVHYPFFLEKILSNYS